MTCLGVRKLNIILDVTFSRELPFLDHFLVMDLPFMAQKMAVKVFQSLHLRSNTNIEQEATSSLYSGLHSTEDGD